ncbi:MAG: DNA mismatch repair endonuclease MutL, partial [Elusimicrobiota bacterium]
MKIKILPASVIDKIAAGEVLQRPASAVKELVENSIDADAKRIEISFEAGGKTITVSDDGSGMSEEEVKLAVKRHATSKIATDEDIDKIKTMGFRGEALASIAAVSRFSLKTKREGYEAIELKLSGGKSAQLLPAARARGTTVTIKDIFYNTPARKKFLKTDATERKHIIRSVELAALSHPEISFSLKEKGNILFDLPPDSLKERTGNIIGKNLSRKLLGIEFKNPYIQLSGYISPPEVSFLNKNRIYFFVNRRPVFSPLLMHATGRGYLQFIPPNKNPACVININIKPEFVDVNVHPAKKEVRFVNQQGVHQILSKVITSKLQDVPGVFEVEEAPAKKKKSRPKPSYSKNSGSMPSQNRIAEPRQKYIDSIDLSRARKFTFTPPSTPENKDSSHDDKDKIIPFFQWKNKYVVGHDSKGIVIIDQHTAWERINYEKLKKEASSRKAAAQGLLIPEVVEYERSRAGILSRHAGVLAQYGLIIEDFGPGAFKITAVPASTAKTLRGEEAADMVESIISLIEKTGKGPLKEELMDEILKLIACRSSIMAGDSLSMDEMRKMTANLN